ncbi:hypothetical protein BY996DRAFT_6547455 [Phakopsora pachyrhizi]|nr:hypothetical protein BY996DRAFT_6547455 [Phakopsora pachyrhizi]
MVLQFSQPTVELKPQINKMNEKVKLIMHQVKKNALLPDGFSWKKNSQSPEEYSKRKFTLPSLNNMIARVKFCECPKNEDDKIYPLQPPRVLSIFYGTTHYGSLALLKKSHLSQHQLLLIPIEPKFTLGQNNCPPK